MADTIDWTDKTPRPLDVLARTAFPDGSGVTAKTLKMRVRQGKLVAYRPGRAYLSSYADIRDMIEKVRIKRDPHPMEGWKAPRPEPPLPLGLTKAELARSALDHALDQLDRQHKAKLAEQRRQRDLELARTSPSTIRKEAGKSPRALPREKSIGSTIIRRRDIAALQRNRTNRRSVRAK